MNRLLKLSALVFVVVLFTAVPAMAQEVTDHGPSNPLSTINLAAIGAAFVTIGAAYGIGKLAASALESMARQPEVAGNIQVAMIIAAALIEGFTFFALYICMICVPGSVATAIRTVAGQ